jgi:hypothetical protein
MLKVRSDRIRVFGASTPSERLVVKVVDLARYLVIFNFLAKYHQNRFVKVDIFSGWSKNINRIDA